MLIHFSELTFRFIFEKTQPSGLLSWSSLSLNNVKYFYRLNINLDNDIVLDDYNSFTAGDYFK